MTPFMVAEMSANHLGSFDLAIRMVEAAAESGADGLKVQVWQPDTMCLDHDYTIKSGPWAGRKLVDLYREAWTPTDWLEPLFDRCRGLGLTPFGSVFDIPSLNVLEGLGSALHKVSSFEIVDLNLIAACAATGKPLIISTGMASALEIEDAVCAAELSGCTDLTLLVCTSAYPARLEDANLARMEAFNRAYGCKVGLSDHTTGPIAAIAAAARGASMIERHFTLDRAYGGPDAAFSTEPTEFAALARDCRAAAAAIGKIEVTPKTCPQEAPQRALRRSLHFSVSWPIGHVLTRTDLISSRPADGLPPKFADALAGRTLAVDVRRGDPVTWDRLES